MYTIKARLKASFGAWNKFWDHSSDVRASLFYGKICSDGQWFFVANGIVLLMVKVVYDGALIKKLRYWPKYFPGDIINRNFSTSRWGVQTCWRMLLKTERHSVSYASKS